VSPIAVSMPRGLGAAEFANSIRNEAGSCRAASKAAQRGAGGQKGYPPQLPARCGDARRILPALPAVRARLPPPTRHEPLCFAGRPALLSRNNGLRGKLTMAEDIAYGDEAMRHFLKMLLLDK